MPLRVNLSSFKTGAVKGEEKDSHTHSPTWTLETQLSCCLTVTQRGTSNGLTCMGSVEVTEAQGCRDCALGTPLSCPSSLNLHLAPLKNILATILERYLRAQLSLATVSEGPRTLSILGQNVSLEAFFPLGWRHCLELSRIPKDGPLLSVNVTLVTSLLM